MKRIIGKYYFPTFIVFLIVFSFKVLLIKSPNEIWVNILIVIGGAFALSLTIGTIYYFQENKWMPSIREKRFSKSPFIELEIHHGFKRMVDFVAGRVKGYVVIVRYEWKFQNRTAIVIRVFFEDVAKEEPLIYDTIKPIAKRNKRPGLLSNPYTWLKNSVRYNMEFGFSAPKYTKVITEIDRIIAILEKEQLKPTRYDDKQEFEEWLKQWYTENEKEFNDSYPPIFP